MILTVGDVIMVDIDGNCVPCTVLTLEPPPAVLELFPGDTAVGRDQAGQIVDIDYTENPVWDLCSIRLLDQGSGRAFWRSLGNLRNNKRFDCIVTVYNYADYVKSNKPDVTVKFLPSVREVRKKKDEKEITASALMKNFTPAEQLKLLEMLKEGKL